MNGFPTAAPQQDFSTTAVSRCGHLVSSCRTGEDAG